MYITIAKGTERGVWAVPEPVGAGRAPGRHRGCTLRPGRELRLREVKGPAQGHRPSLRESTEDL